MCNKLYQNKIVVSFVPTAVWIVIVLLIVIGTPFITVAQNSYSPRTGLFLTEHNHSDFFTPNKSSLFPNLKGKTFSASKLLSDSLNVRFLGKALYGLAISVSVRDTIAFVGTATSLLVLNIADPVQPQLLSHLHHTYTDLLNIHVSGDFAYLSLSSFLPWGEEGAIEIVNISNPKNPIKVGYFRTQSATISVYVFGNYGYVCTGTKLLILDISNPTNPVQVSSLDFGGMPNFTNGVEVVGNYAYVAATAAGLQIVDVSNPAAPFVVGMHSTALWSRQVRIVGSYAYVLGAFGMSSNLEIIDISTPANPTLVSSTSLSEGAIRMYISGSNAYVAVQETPSLSGLRGALNILDISIPANPTMVGSCKVEGGPFGVDGNSGFAFAAAKEGGLIVIDVFNPNTPSPVAYYNTGSFAHSVKVDGNIAYVADTNPNWPNKGTIRTVDISNPTSPIELSAYLTGGEAREIFVRQPYAYIANGFNGLRIVDISDPNNIQEIGNYTTPNMYAAGINVSGNYAYIANFDSLRIVDISNISIPSLTSKLLLPSEGRHIFIKDNLAFISCVNEMVVVDISNPFNPIKLASQGGRPWQIYVIGNLAYIADYESGLKIVDISNPSNLIVVGSYITSGSAISVYVSGNIAYVGTIPNYGGPKITMGIEVINVSNPVNPVKVGYYNLYDIVYDVFVKEKIVYVANAMQGLSILEFTGTTGVELSEDNTPHNYILSQNYPNPFNPSTTIRFTIPQRSHVTLKVFDVLGREVVMLVNEPKQAGEYEVVFNASNLSSGVYFYRLQVGGFVQTRKMILAK